MRSRVMQFEKRIQRTMFGALVGALCFIGTASAASPEIQVATSAEEVFVGDSIDYQVEIRNVQNPPAPDLSDFKDQFDVIASGNESRDQSSVTIINGRVSKQSVLSHLYHYRLTPKLAGDLTIPSAKVTVEGKLIKSDEVPLRVVAAEEQDLVIGEISVTPERVYPTQPFTVTLKILVQPLPNSSTQDPLTPLQRRPPHIQLNWADSLPGLSTGEKSNWLQPLLSENGVGFTLNDVNTRSGSFFDGPRAAVFNLGKGREVKNGLDGTEIKYFVYELSRTFMPEKTGTYTFGPALIKGTFVTGVERKEYTARRLVAIASAVNIEVREVPTPRPATFCGGIGEFKAAASASPTTLRVGDPLTLTLEIEKGKQSGSLELVSAPDLSSIDALVTDFDLVDKNPTGRVDGDRKKFAYALRPKRSGVQIPALKISTFNPKSEEFEELETTPIPIQVSEADRLTSGELIGARSSSAAASLKTRAEGIFQNITDPSELWDQRINFLTWAKAAIGAWAVAACLIGLLTFYRQKTSDPVWVRRQQAKGTALRRMAEAKSLAAKTQSAESLRCVRSAILGLIADSQNLVAEGLTSADVRRILSLHQVPEADRDSVFNLLELIEAADYGAGPQIDTDTAIQDATNWITRMASRLDRGANR
jgi:hypothetical protein